MNNSASEAAETDRLCGSSVFPHCSIASPPRIRYMRFGDEGELGGRRGGGVGGGGDGKEEDGGVAAHRFSPLCVPALTSTQSNIMRSVAQQTKV